MVNIHAFTHFYTSLNSVPRLLIWLVYRYLVSLPKLVNFILSVFGEGFLKEGENCGKCTITSEDEQLFFVERLVILVVSGVCLSSRHDGHTFTVAILAQVITLTGRYASGRAVCSRSLAGISDSNPAGGN
jgi:hypothetical protein